MADKYVVIDRGPNSAPYFRYIIEKRGWFTSEMVDFFNDETEALKKARELSDSKYPREIATFRNGIQDFGF